MVIRRAREEDAEAILDIYTPYVLNTAITFEYTPPTIKEMRSRIQERKEKYPFIVLEDEGWLCVSLPL